MKYFPIWWVGLFFLIVPLQARAQDQPKKEHNFKLTALPTTDQELDKRVAGPLNLILGAQYQFNKRWILRTELGVFGRRTQFLLNLNYRFQGFVKRK